MEYIYMDPLVPPHPLFGHVCLHPSGLLHSLSVRVSVFSLFRFEV